MGPADQVIYVLVDVILFNLICAVGGFCTSMILNLDDIELSANKGNLANWEPIGFFLGGGGGFGLKFAVTS